MQQSTNLAVYDGDQIALGLTMDIANAPVILTIGVRDRTLPFALKSAALQQSVVQLMLQMPEQDALDVVDRLINVLSDARATLMQRIADPEKAGDVVAERV